MASLITRRLVAIVPLVFLFPASTLANLPGLTSGSFRVSDNGSATFTVPIRTPAGTAGMQPAVSLSYSSDAGNGLVGVGWQLSGFPAIGRCPQNYYIDGQIGGVNHDQDDRFCLDGSRLILANGTYGTDGGEYRTELDNFSRIVSYGSSPNLNGGTSPAYFKAWTKGGLIIEYGNTAGSKVRLPGDGDPMTGSIHRWLVNRIEDRHGNYYEVIYDELETEQCLPVQVNYTGNDSQGLSPDLSLRFEYEAKPDSIEQYVQGGKFNNGVRLKSIASYTDETKIREYQMTYEQSAVSGNSRLIDITECGTKGQTTTCESGHTFTWKDDDSLISFTGAVEAVDPGSIEDLKSVYVGDWNNDGLSDMLWHSPENGKNRWMINSGNMTFTEIRDPIDKNRIENFPIYLADLNGDGFTDIVWYNPNEGENRFFVNSGDFTFIETTDPIPNHDIKKHDNLYVGDWNHDGISDLLWHRDDKGWNRWYLNDGQLNFTLVNDPIPPARIEDDDQFKLGDFNGDGIVDVLAYVRSSGRTRIFLNDNLQFAEISDNLDGNLIKEGNGLSVHDWNSDGVADLFWYNDSGHNRFFINQADGNFVGTLDPIDDNVIAGGKGLSFGDWNGDGFSDVMWYQKGTGAQEWFINDGKLNFTRHSDVISRVELDGLEARFHGDWNGDAITDAVWWKDGTGDNQFYTNEAVISDRIIEHTNALGAVTEVDYKPLTDDSVYTSDDPLVYPVQYPEQAVRFPRYVVSEHRKSDGIGGLYAMTYHYGGARMDVRDFGWLGFRWREVTDPQNAIATKETYS